MAEDARSDSADQVAKLIETSLVETALVESWVETLVEATLVEASLVEASLVKSWVEALIEASLVEASLVEGSVGSVPSQAREEVTQTEDASVSLVGTVGILGKGRPHRQAQQYHPQHL